ncbi:MAG: UDP-N-acetylmuramoylalanyl-D-glutamyl-2, 6-diaminopimelate--D-alanyl-D-alanine ligase, partial [Burkholderiales bacterium]|nr:UDP-N-acetylmuramoylalanyl-D-glutamyl-2, 6-diaminopimelate--D-alanyl-D-alanine ligase [Burkholderiales bacterium]
GIEHFWTAGALSQHAATAYGVQARAFDSAVDIVAALQSHQAPTPVASVLVKGSRFMKMEQVVNELAGGSHAA